MEFQTFLISFLLFVAVVYLIMRLGSGRKKPSSPVVRRIRQQPRPPAGEVAVKPSESEPALPEEPAVAEQSPTAADSTAGVKPQRPLARAEIEVETLWRLEHTLRELPEVAETPIVQIDYSMEPKEIATVLASNPFYAGKILKTVNSAAFGLRSRIDSLPRAITYLGYNQVKNIIFQHTMRSKLLPAGSGAGGIDLLAFWKHSHAVSVCAEFMLHEFLRDVRNVGAITTAALMHDIGWIVFPQYDPGTAEVLCSRLGGESGEENPVAAEEELFGFNHLIAGKMVAEQWSIPEQVVELIELHHCASFGFGGELPQRTKLGAAVVSRAEELAGLCGFPNPLLEPVEQRIALEGILGTEAASLGPENVRLRQDLEKTMRIIEEFEKAGGSSD